ncbi:adenosylcobinamide-GDP ribazoletransferase [Hymenobacter artigasi]|uniref:Adenosylcobinamide-GDP ribazoletransferase n=1 Tax=Hymenobacter artigasi TaxID=2719616 RepID=A0ABX1HHA8_9BACT|nr:adenosylcobinamide-GDP ribazoletransferase [Hymenobacter artigasi]NKI89641.1 adenosylcobinamide-GDP ribazoletransferase [Hymenobacter artigasi]
MPDSWPRAQLRLLLTAVMFYTRLPCPRWVGHEPEQLNRATVYFPLIGWLVGAGAAAVYWGAALLWPPVVAVLLSTGAGVLLTGAFHEDGLADMCDGFGGGWTRARILDIMKDSRIGTYGLVGLGLVLAIKVAALSSAANPGRPGLSVPVLLLVAHPLSRLTALTFVRTLPYAREDLDDGKAKPVAQSMPNGRLAVAALLGLAPLLALVLWRPAPALLWVLLPLLVLQLVLGRWFKRWLGGYTGDCLGATQQLAEALIYLSLTVHLA